MSDKPSVSANNEIEAFLHCAMCIEEKPADMSMREYGSYEIGWTPHGFQMWCIRHECNVMHIDFQGQKHPANTHRLKTDEEVRVESHPKLKLVKKGDKE